MAWYVALRDFELGEDKVHVPRGHTFEIQLRSLAQHHLKQGDVTFAQLKVQRRGSYLKMDREHQMLLGGMRIGMWLETSSHYSGGRIHMFQYALAAAEHGAEVWLITQILPKWREDYFSHPRLHIVVDDETNPIPQDFDIITSDAKGPLGKKAGEWRQRYPGSRYMVWNFETPNWVENFVPDYAKALFHGKQAQLLADIVANNSMEGEKYLRQWLCPEGWKGLTTVLNPALNDRALAEALRLGPLQTNHPHVVWSSRSPGYKHLDLAIEVVRRSPTPLSLVAIGQPKLPEGERFVAKSRITDVEKFRWMMGAELVLHPSLFEGFGMVPMEALASGTPCLVFDLPVYREVYKDLVHYVPWSDGEAYVKRAHELLRSPKSLSPETAKTCRVRFSQKTQAQEVDLMPYHRLTRPSVSVGMIAYWGFWPESIESIYKDVDEIFIAVGRDEKAPKMDDGSLERIRSFKDPEGKIVISDERTWGGKLQMRQWCLSQMQGNWHLMLDGDEIWVGLREWLQSELYIGTPRWTNLWKGAEYWIHDERSDGPGLGRWGRPIGDGHGGSINPHYRISWLRRAYKFSTHWEFTDAYGNGLRPKTRNEAEEAARRVPACHVYHLGLCIPQEVMQAKYEYYLARDGWSDVIANQRDLYLKWSGQTGSTKDGVISKVDWKIPEIVTKALSRKGVSRCP